MAGHKDTTKYQTGTLMMRIAAVLFCLTLFSVHLTSGLYARYVTKAAGEDAARVIRFGELTITESGDFETDGTMIFIPGVPLTKKAEVAFTGSEAATYVFVEITVSNDWTTQDNYTFLVKKNNKEMMQWKVDSNWVYLQTTGATYIYYRALAPNTPLQADIIADAGKVTVSNQITKQEMEQMNDISIQFRATAVQSNGFADPDAAWESVAKK